MAKKPQSKSDKVKSNKSVSQTEEYGVDIAIQLFAINPREVKFIKNKYKDQNNNVVDWKEQFQSNDIMFSNDPTESDSEE